VSKRHLLFVALKRLGVFRKMHNSHIGRTLGEHLINTYDDLVRMGAEEDVALGGGLHSIYGTNAFKKITVTPEQRPIIQGLFGERAERLAWLFSRVNRPKGLEDGYPLDYQTGQPLAMTEQDFEDLQMIEVANLLDNGVKLAKYPTLHQIHEAIRP
jgi:hypothetical protein